MPVNRFTLYRVYTNKKTYPSGPVIYKIVNIINGKVYIGQTINFQDRKKWHQTALKKKFHSSQKLQRSYDKYGIDNFYIEIIEQLEFKDLESRENYWIRKYQSLDKGFNSNAKSIPYYGKRSIEQRQNMSKAQIGKKVSQESKDNMSKARKGRFIGKDSPIARSVVQYDLDMNKLATYESINQASIITGIQRTGINNCVCKRAHTAGSFIWKYNIIKS